MTRDITQALARWLAAGFNQIGEISIEAVDNGGYELRHFHDRDRQHLEMHRAVEDARALANIDDAGRFRPLKSAPTLRHGWRLIVANLESLHRALDFFYPAMLGVLLSHESGELEPVPLRETLQRQSGMYAVTKKITDPEAQQLIASFCDSRGGCLKTILWRIAPDVPVTSLPQSKFDPLANQLGTSRRVLPMLCHEACNLLVAKAREVVKKQSEIT